MCLKYRSERKGPGSQRGLGLITAIFVITIMSLLVAAMSLFYQASQAVTAQEYLSARAMMAAQSGLELETSELLHPDLAGSAVCSASAAETALADIGFNCRAEVSCQRVTVASQSYLTISSLGRCGTGIDSASRRVQLRVVE